MWTTRVSNPVRYPHFRASASVSDQKAAFATGVLPDIYAFHRYTRNSTFSLPNSRLTVSKAILRLSRKLSPQTYQPAYAPFTPNNSGQRSPPPYYRDCWHGVSRGFSVGTVIGEPYSNSPYSSLLTAVYTPKSVIPHAALLRQSFLHCAIFLTAASRRSLGRISVPVWPITLSGRLPIVALVGRYPAN